jgi:hypothetical protein
MIVFDLFEQDPNFRKPVEYENRKQYGTVNFANFIKAYQSKPTRPVQFDFPGNQSYKLSGQWVDMLADYYNTLETNADRAQLIYGTLIDYNKAMKFLNTLAQQKLFEKKSSATDPEFKSTKLARLKTQARAKYPAAANDMEAMAADFVDGLEKDQKEFERVKSVNRRQDELLKQITALNQEQDNEIRDLESEEAELQRNIQQVQSANAELAKKLADMSAQRSSKKDSTKDKEQQATTTGTVSIADFEPTKAEPTEVEPQKSTPVAPTGSAFPYMVKATTDNNDKSKGQANPVTTSTVAPTGISKQPDNVIDLFPDSDISKPEKEPTSATEPEARDDNVYYLPTSLQKTDDEEKAAESINEADAIPLKKVFAGYTITFDPDTKTVSASRGLSGPQQGKSFKLNSATPGAYLRAVRQLLGDEVAEGSVFGQQKFDTQMNLAKLKSQLTQPKPAQSAPADTTEPQPVAYQSPARLSDLQVRKQRVDNLADIKQDIEKLQARATRGGRELPRGLAADLEDYFTTADIDTAYDDMMTKYQRQLGALQQYLGMRKALWSPRKDVHKMKAKELQEGGPETWTVHFTDGTTTRVRVPSDETDPAQVRAFFANKGKTVKKFDYGFGTEPAAGPGPEPHEPGSGSAVSGRTGKELPEDALDRSGQKMYQAKEVYMLTHNGQEVAFYTLKDLKRAEQDAQDMQKKLGGEVHLRKVMREGEGSWKKETPWTKSTGKDPRGEVTHMSDVARRETEKIAKDSSPMGQLFKDFEKIFGKKPPVKEGDVVNINRGGYNEFRDRADWLDKRDYVQQQLLDPRQRNNYPELKQRLLDINSAGRELGYTK